MSFCSLQEESRGCPHGIGRSVAEVRTHENNPAGVSSPGTKQETSPTRSRLPFDRRPGPGPPDLRHASDHTADASSAFPVL
jgi:hypothetical protein